MVLQDSTRLVALDQGSKLSEPLELFSFTLLFLNFGISILQFFQESLALVKAGHIHRPDHGWLCNVLDLRLRLGGSLSLIGMCHGDRGRRNLFEWQ